MSVKCKNVYISRKFNTNSIHAKHVKTFLNWLSRHHYITVCVTPAKLAHIYIYYTSEEFFLYKIAVDKRTIHHFSRQNELLTGT